MKAKSKLSRTFIWSIFMLVLIIGISIPTVETVQAQGPTHSISLVAGWNLVSFYVHPPDTSIAAVLSSVSEKYDLVYAWDPSGGHSGSGNWMKYAPADPPYANTLSDLDETMGFWIHMTIAGTLTVEGATTNSYIPLSVNAGGWNLVGYPCPATRALPDALSLHGAGTDFSLVYAYHASDASDPWKLFDRTAPVYVNDLTDMATGWGYWIDATANHSWEIDCKAPTLDITGATADGTAMSGDLSTGYILNTTNNPAIDHLIQFAAGTTASETLENTYFGLKLVASTVSPADLKAYYLARGVPEPFLTYLNNAADGTNPFVYIKGLTVTLVDAAKHDILATDVAMTVPDDYPLGTYTVQGQIRDLAGNETTVTLILIVK